MKVLLTTSPRRKVDIPIYPLGLSYIADSVSRQHSVQVLDVCLVKDVDKAIREKIGFYQPDIIGISLTYLDTACSYENFSYFSLFSEYIEKIKKYSNAVIIVGGAGFSLMPRRIMETIVSIDIGVYLEGEETIHFLLSNLSQPKSVKGVFYRDKGKVLFSGDKSFADFSKIPSLSRKFFKLKDYFNSPEQIGVQTKRGCIFDCNYCSYTRLEGKGIRMRSADDVIDELQELSQQGTEKIMFSDSVFNCSKAHAESICKKILERGLEIKWRAYFTEKNIDRRFVRLAKEAGCELFILGTDGASDKVLTKLKKPFDVFQVKKAYEALAAEDVKFYSGFMWNAPGQEINSLWDIIRLTFKYLIFGNLIFHLSTIRIYPNTGIYSQAIKEGILKEDKDLLYPVYYDRWPLSILSKIFNLTQKMLYFCKSKADILWKRPYLLLV